MCYDVLNIKRCPKSRPGKKGLILLHIHSIDAWLQIHSQQY